MFPPTISTTPNSPMVWAKLSATPVTSPEIESGRITRKKVFVREAPSVAEAAMSLLSTAEKDAAKGCTANGRLYRIEPITRPSKVNADGRAGLGPRFLEQAVDLIVSTERLNRIVEFRTLYNWLQRDRRVPWDFALLAEKEA